MEVFFIILLSILLIISAFIIVNLYIKNRRLTEANDEYDEWFGIFSARIRETIDTINDIDYSGVFEADDDVGNAFKSIRDIINDLNGLIINDEDNRM